MIEAFDKLAQAHAEEMAEAQEEIETLRKQRNELLAALREATRWLAWHVKKRNGGPDVVALNHAHATINKADRD